MDEHTTATNGRYELEEALEQEFKLGACNYRYDTYYPPIFKKMKDVQLEYCNSESKLLVRAADIVANKIFYLARNEKRKELRDIQNLKVIDFVIGKLNRLLLMIYKLFGKIICVIVF